MLVSSVQQNESDIYVYIYTPVLFHILLPYKLLKSIE